MKSTNAAFLLQTGNYGDKTEIMWHENTKADQHQKYCIQKAVFPVQLRSTKLFFK